MGKIFIWQTLRDWFCKLYHLGILCCDFLAPLPLLDNVPFGEGTGTSLLGQFLYTAIWIFCDLLCVICLRNRSTRVQQQTASRSQFRAVHSLSSSRIWWFIFLVLLTTYPGAQRSEGCAVNMASAGAAQTFGPSAAKEHVEELQCAFELPQTNPENMHQEKKLQTCSQES